LSTEEVIRESWKPLNVNNQPFTGTGNVNEICGDIAERVIKASMIKESLDNLSVVVIAFKNFAKYIERLSVWI
jgi:dihydroxyacid dehydratase/phosphogluconate dehydratase